MATFNVEITSKAQRNFEDLSKRLIDMHCKFDPTARRKDIKVITHYLHNSTGNWLHTGSGQDGMNYRYIRVVIDVMAGAKDAADKDDLMRRALECCMDFEGKHASECEIEVRINEIEQCHVMRVDPAVVK